MNLYSQRIWRVALAAAMMLAVNASLWSRDDKPKKDKEAPKEQKSVVIVKIRKDALLEIEGSRTKATGEERSFESPPLPARARSTITPSSPAGRRTITPRSLARRRSSSRRARRSRSI